MSYNNFNSKLIFRFLFPSSVQCKMILISSETLKKEIMALPKQMTAVMNTTAESLSEIPLIRYTINVKVSFLSLIVCPFGEDWVLCLSRCCKANFKCNHCIFKCIYISLFLSFLFGSLTNHPLQRLLLF